MREAWPSIGCASPLGGKPQMKMSNKAWNNCGPNCLNLIIPSKCSNAQNDHFYYGHKSLILGGILAPFLNYFFFGQWNRTLMVYCVTLSYVLKGMPTYLSNLPKVSVSETPFLFPSPLELHHVANRTDFYNNNSNNN